MASKCGCPVCQGRRRWFKPMVGIGAGLTATLPVDADRVAVIISGSPDASGAFLVYPIVRVVHDGALVTNAPIETGLYLPFEMRIETYGQLVTSGMTILNDSSTSAIRVQEVILKAHDESDAVQAFVGMH